MDEWLLRFVNVTLAGPVLDAVMPVVSVVGLALCPAVGVALWVLKPNGDARRRRRVGAAVLAALAVGLVLTLVFQYVVLRPRPEGVRLLAPPPNFPSFPSGHAMAGFATATVLALSARRGRVAVPVFVGAALVAASRVYLGHHFPSDVLAGAVLGVGAGAAAHGLVLERGPARARWRWLVWLQAALIVVVSQVAYMGRLPLAVLTLPYTDKVLHFVMFGSVAFWLSLWLGPRRLAGVPAAIALPFGLAALEEGAQALSSVRSAGLDDLAADLAGMVVFWWMGEKAPTDDRRQTLRSDE